MQAICQSDSDIQVSRYRVKKCVCSSIYHKYLENLIKLNLEYYGLCKFEVIHKPLGHAVHYFVCMGFAQIALQQVADWDPVG